MSETQPSTGNAPSADELKRRLDEMGEQANLGSGEDEPDPATSETPPKDRQEGSKERNQT